MRVMIAEYAVGSRDERRIHLIREGKAMLNALKKSFEALGHEVVSPYAERDFANAVERLSKESDAGIVIAPDDMLAELTVIVEENTLNLGCPSDAVRICADKLKTTEILLKNGIPAPRIINAVCNDFSADFGSDDRNTRNDASMRAYRSEYLSEYQSRYVIKPRYGCGSEGVFIVNGVRAIHSAVNASVTEAEVRKRAEEDVQTVEKKAGDVRDVILTEYVEGDDVSVSMVASASKQLLLTVNKQYVSRVAEIDVRGSDARDARDAGDVRNARDAVYAGNAVKERLKYEGCLVPYAVGERWEGVLKRLSERVARIFGCRGYFGIDFVLGDDAYVVDVNPRATTTLVCVAKVLNVEIADLILRAAWDELPSEVRVDGVCSFRL